MIVELTRIRSATLARASFPFASSLIIHPPKRLQGVPITVIYTDMLNKRGIGVKSPLD
jgi:hypothetical protein